MTDPDPTPDPSLLDRMRSAGIGEDRARAYIAAGAVQVAGTRVSDPDVTMPPGARWVINPQ